VRVYPAGAALAAPSSTFIYVASGAAGGLFGDGLDYEVTATLVDVPGNEALDLLIGSFDVDTTPAGLVGPATLSTTQLKLGDTLGVAFTVSEPLLGLEDSPPALPVVRFAGSELDTGAQDPVEPLRFTFSTR